jgi:hypothetical protein
MKNYIFSNVKDQLLNHLNNKKPGSIDDNYTRPVPHITLNNGVIISVQASTTHYCHPKINYGVWDSVEVYLDRGMVSQELLKYQEGDGIMLVMGFVPIDLVVAEIIVSGGIKEENNDENN